jgi:hypothetical protein
MNAFQATRRGLSQRPRETRHSVDLCALANAAADGRGATCVPPFQNMEILMAVSKELEAEGKLRQPLVAFEPGLAPGVAEQLGAAVKRLGGAVAASPGEAGLETRAEHAA